MGGEQIAESAVRLEQFQPELASISQQAAEVDIRTYEVKPAEVISGELQKTTLGLLGRAREVLAAVIATAECLGGESDDDIDSALGDMFLPFEQAIDATVAAGLGSTQAVEEVAFLAQMELRQRHERLERTQARHGAAQLLSECDSSLRRIRKAFSAVDTAIAEVEGVAPCLNFTSELQSSLMVRHAYARFRRSILDTPEPTAETIRACFRSAGTSIARLVGWEAYPEMRVRDRLALRDLQQRILGWLRDEDASFTEGTRIWQDFVAFVEMLSQVNRRQELVEHDGSEIPKVLELLNESSSGALAPPQAVEQANRLSGLDDQLDGLLAADAVSSGELRDVLLRLNGLFSCPGTHAP